MPRPHASCPPRARIAAAALAMGALLPQVSACGVAIGAGATAGVAAYQERGLDGAARDTRTATEIRAAFFTHNHVLPVKVSIEVYEGRVLLTGVVDDPALRADAVRLAWKAGGVKDVINEIQIASEAGVLEFAHDSWITAQLESRITLDKKISAVNYSVETTNGIVYIIGIAQDQAELDRVIAYARSIDRVRQVVSHVRVKVQPS
jgi:osmotically-inducible protein OsmY